MFRVAWAPPMRPVFFTPEASIGQYRSSGQRTSLVFHEASSILESVDGSI